RSDGVLFLLSFPQGQIDGACDRAWRRLGDGMVPDDPWRAFPFAYFVFHGCGVAADLSDCPACSSLSSLIKGLPACVKGQCCVRHTGHKVRWRSGRELPSMSGKDQSESQNYKDCPGNPVHDQLAAYGFVETLRQLAAEQRNRAEYEQRRDLKQNAEDGD